MKKFVSAPLAFLCALFLTISLAQAAPVDQKVWLSCAQDNDCVSVELGCSYWQPVNAKHADDIVKAHPSACLNSVFPGPQPTVSCVDHVCVNDPYTVKFWKSSPGLELATVDARLHTCIDKAGLAVNSTGYAYVDFREPFLKKMEENLGKGIFDDKETLQQAAEQTIICADAVAAAKATPNTVFKKP